MKYLAILAAFIAGIWAADAFGESNESMREYLPPGATVYVSDVMPSWNLAAEKHRVFVATYGECTCHTFVYTNDMYYKGEKVRLVYHFDGTRNACGDLMYTALLFREP